MRKLLLISFIVISLSGCSAAPSRSPTSDKNAVDYVNKVLCTSEQYAINNGCHNGLSDIESELCLLNSFEQAKDAKDKDRFNDSMKVVKALLKEGKLKQPGVFYKWVTP